MQQIREDTECCHSTSDCDNNVNCEHGTRWNWWSTWGTHLCGVLSAKWIMIWWGRSHRFSHMTGIDGHFITSFTHAQTCDNVRLWSSRKRAASVQTLYMPMFALESARKGLLWSRLYTCRSLVEPHPIRSQVVFVEDVFLYFSTRVDKPCMLLLSKGLASTWKIQSDDPGSFPQQLRSLLWCPRQNSSCGDLGTGRFSSKQFMPCSDVVQFNICFFPRKIFAFILYVPPN